MAEKKTQLNNILCRIMFSTNQSVTSLPNLELLKTKMLVPMNHGCGICHARLIRLVHKTCQTSRVSWLACPGTSRVSWLACPGTSRVSWLACPGTSRVSWLACPGTSRVSWLACPGTSRVSWLACPGTSRVSWLACPGTSRVSWLACPGTSKDQQIEIISY